MSYKEIKIIEDSFVSKMFKKLLTSNSSKYENTKNLVHAWNNLMKVLSNDEMEVLMMRLGLLDGRKKTFEEVGKKLMITREQARQKELRAYRVIRHPLYVCVFNFLTSISNFNKEGGSYDSKL